MRGDNDIFENLGLNPLEPERCPPGEQPSEGITTDSTEVADIFDEFGFGPTPGKPLEPGPEKPKRVRRMSSFEKAWEPSERLAKRLEWKERSAKSLLFDEPLNNEGDPYERDIHSRPHR